MNGLNQTCTIRPRWLNVNVTYVRGGSVALEPTQNLSDISFTSSLLIQTTMVILERHFAYTQTIMGNHMLDTISRIVTNMFTPSSPEFPFKELFEKATVSAHYTMTVSYWPHEQSTLLVRLITFEACSNMERQWALFLQRSNGCLLTIM